VDFGRVVVGTTRDSIVTGIVHNTGTVPLHIDDIRIAGANQGEFLLRSAAGPYDIPSGAALSLEVEFVPSATGRRSATVDLITPNGTASIDLRGEGGVPQLAITPARIDFGQVIIGERRDSVVTMMVRNMSSLPVTVTDVARQGPDLTQFSIVGGGGTFTLDPGEGRTLTLRFAPRFIGRTSGRIAFAYEGPGSPAAAYLTGQGLGGIVSVANDSGAPGDRVDIPLVLSGPHRYIDEAGTTAFEADLRFNAQLLLPAGKDHGVISDGKRMLTVNGIWDGKSDTLVRIPLIAGLGDTTATDVDIIRFAWLDAGGERSSTDIETRDAAFNIVGLCITGPDRLITAAGNARLKQLSPNPASLTVTIEYDLVEDGHARIVVTDILGREVAILSDGESRAGHYSLTSTVAILPAGTYFYLLEIPTRRITQRFEVAR
jgi:hypothetical protein